MRFFLSLIFILIGSLLVIKTNWLVQNFGHSAWAEAKMGMWGGTRAMIKLIGVALVILGFLYASGLLGRLVLSFVPPVMVPTY